MITWEQFLQNKLEEGKNWIQGAIKHPGRCTPAPNKDCPKGSPQYNLAMRFKHGDLHKKRKRRKSNAQDRFLKNY